MLDLLDKKIKTLKFTSLFYYTPIVNSSILNFEDKMNLSGDYENYADMFKKATSLPAPYPFQEIFATTKEIHHLVNVPTGLGKTAMIILGWIWRRRFAAGLAAE